MEPMSVSDDPLSLANPLPMGLRRCHYGTQAHGNPSLCRPNPGAPIAQVLNNEAPIAYTPLPTFTSPTTPFSGRLADLLLDDPEQVDKRRKGDHCTEPSTQAACENPVFKLPELPLLPKKTTKRPRIPPLLQGLHQPPPLPAGRLFPPITSEKTDFARNPGKRVGFDTHAEEARSKAEDVRGGVGTSVGETKRPGQDDTELLEHHIGSQPPLLNPAHELEQPNERPQLIWMVGPAKYKRTRARNKWTEEETEDLLAGVTKYGIGSWKRILEDPEYTFTQRTAVDRYDILFMNAILSPLLTLAVSVISSAYALWHPFICMVLRA